MAVEFTDPVKYPMTSSYTAVRRIIRQTYIDTAELCLYSFFCITLPSSLSAYG